MEHHRFNDRVLTQLHLGHSQHPPRPRTNSIPQTSANLNRRPRPRSLSLPEALVATQTNEFTQRLFHWMDPPSLFNISRTSRIMHGAIKVYTRETWNIEELFTRYMDKESVIPFRKLLMASRALVFGPVALMFFDRLHKYSARLDIAAPLNAITDFAHFFLLQGYCVSGGVSKFIGQLKKYMGPRTFSGNGDMHLEEADRTRDVKFIFSKKRRPDLKDNDDVQYIVIIHLIQCEAYQFVLAQHSSKSMAFSMPDSIANSLILRYRSVDVPHFTQQSYIAISVDDIQGAPFLSSSEYLSHIRQRSL